MSRSAAKALLDDLINLALNPHTKPARLGEVARQFREEVDTLREPLLVHVALHKR